MKKKLLFVIYGGGHAHMVYPVVHVLRESDAYKKGEIEIEVLGLPAARRILNANGVECFGFSDFMDKDMDADAIAWGTELAKIHHSPTLGVELEDSIAYLGLNYKDLVTRLGQEQAEKLFKEKVRHAFYPLTVMERIFDKIKPDFVVTSNSPRSEAAAIEIANKRGIGTLIMTDLFTGLGGYVLQAQNITFLNEFAKNMFLADGLINPAISNFYCTGNPAFDKILALPLGKDETWIREHFPEAGGRKLVLHADMPAYWHPEKKCSYTKADDDIIKEMDACYQAAIGNGAVYLIRPHPSQDRNLYQDWLKGKKDAYLAADCNLHALLRNIDLLIARTTTVALEASYMQKRILQLDADFHIDLPLATMGIAWGVNSYDEIAAHMHQALTDDKEFVRIKERVNKILPREPANDKIGRIILEKLWARP